ncbi:hypothetical protein B0T14DRAFT_248140 [Immersiella caudata]|uniref:Uncharacterized protein n=1 Tax=Immersiella caudata TaxID=314043 RepID=A0AA39WJF6_9PEZI|nr:hypothetical protein B0T14DRAFT_248140 [Immersiella caudata]
MGRLWGRGWLGLASCHSGSWGIICRAALERYAVGATRPLRLLRQSTKGIHDIKASITAWDFRESKAVQLGTDDPTAGSSLGGTGYWQYADVCQLSTQRQLSAQIGEVG